MAGYLADIDEWNNASDHWQTVLKTPRQLEYFKSTGIQERSKPPFKNWDLEDALLKAGQLSEVIKSARITSFMVCVYWDHFFEVRREFDNTAEIKPYGILFNGVMATITDFIIQSRSSESVQFEFDDQGKEGEEALSIYKEVKEMLPRQNADLITGYPSFSDDTKVMPLQMADMFAWNIRRYISDNGGEFPRIKNGVAWFKKPSRILQNVVKNPALWTVYDSSTLRKMFSQWDHFLSEKSSREDIRKSLESERLHED